MYLVWPRYLSVYMSQFHWDINILTHSFSFLQFVPYIYDAVKARLAAMNITASLPDQFPFNLNQLDDIGFYSAIETGLYNAMKVTALN